MPTRPTLIVDDDTGTERFRLTCERAADNRSLVEQWTATATVDRADWLAVRDQLDEVADRLRIERGDESTLFGGRFRDDSRDGNTVVVTIASYEQDAIDAEPTAGLEVFQNVTDDTVATDAIDAVPTLVAGTVDQTATGLSFSFSHAERSKQLRDAAEPGGAEIAYNADRTVDYLTALGADKTGTVISSVNQDIVNTLRVQENNRDPVTHIRGLGAQQGDDQVQAEAVIASYAGGRQVWREYTNKDIVNQSRLQTIVNRLADEYDTERRRITVEAGLVGVDVELGDRITVDLTEHDIDRPLRIVNIREILSNTQRFVVTLTNRNVERAGSRKRRDDLKRFNSGYQGFIDRDTDSYGWQPVTATVNATRPYPYPDDVVSERTAEVIVNSIPYRAYSSGAASGGGSVVTSQQQNGTTLSIENTPDLGSDTLLTPGDDVTVSEAVDAGFSEYVAFYGVNVSTDGDYTDVEITFDGGAGGIYDETVTTDSLGNADIYLADPNTEVGDIAELRVRNPDNSTSDLTVQASGTGWNLFDPDHEHDVTFPNHTHPAEPGLIEFPAETATDVDLIVNGNTVATDIGSGEFTTTVDIAGELTAGNNTIEATSDSLGLLNLTVQSQLFRQGTPSP